MRDLTALRGKSIVEFFPRLLELHPQIKKLTFTTYKPGPKLSQRLDNVLSSEETELRDKASAVCKGNGIPFWDAVLGISMKDGAIPERFVEAALVHDFAPSEQEFVLQNHEVTVERLQTIIDGLSTSHGLAISSRLHLVTEEVAHLPMVDFRCPYAEGNYRAIRRVLRDIGQPDGILVQSGRSYHSYGFSLLSPAEWVRFMGKLLLFAPVTDARYVAHRLIDGECRLKIAPATNEPSPTIVEVWSSSN
jgi:hypothetical protein